MFTLTSCVENHVVRHVEKLSCLVPGLRVVGGQCGVGDVADDHAVEGERDVVRGVFLR